MISPATIERFYLLVCVTARDCFSDGYYTSRHEAEAAAATLHSNRCATCGGALWVAVVSELPDDGQVVELMVRRNSSPENTNPDVVGDIGAAERTPAPTPESTQAASAESTLAPLALGSSVVSAVERMMALEREICWLTQARDDLSEQLESAVATYNELSELASAQGEKLMRFTDLAYAANSADLDVRNCRLAIRQLAGTADHERCLDAAGAALKRYRRAVVAILALAGVVRIPPDLTMCDQ